MKPLDRFIQKLRIRQALAHVPSGAEVLDIGCDDGALFRFAGKHISGGLGVDPGLAVQFNGGHYQLVPGKFPQAVPPGAQFDVITMLAVLEHLQPEEQQRTMALLADYLKPAGKVILTVPAAAVDRILDLLRTVRVIDGMELDEHHGFDPQQVFNLVPEERLVLEHQRKFELGLNNLFVFRKPDGRNGDSGTGKTPG